MNMEHVKALAKGAWHNARLNHNGVELWSQGHIIVPAECEGDEKPSMAGLWEKISNREGEISCEPMSMYQSGPYIYRELRTETFTVVINEAYRRVVQDDESITIHVVSPDGVIAFRRGGELVGAVMPVRWTIDQDYVIADPDLSDEEVFRHLANEKNDWYLQGPEELRKRLRKALAE